MCYDNRDLYTGNILESEWPPRPSPADPRPCPECDAYGMIGYDRNGRPIPCPKCGGTGRR